MKFFNRKKLHMHDFVRPDDFHKQMVKQILAGKHTAEIETKCKCGETEILKAVMMLERKYGK